jgi:uncharacterized protein YggE
MKSNRAIAAGAVALAAVGLGACGSGSKTTEVRQAVPVVSTPSDRASISVAGHGKITGTPDTATVTMGVETKDPSAQAAMQRNNAEAAALIATLKEKGVAAKDIQTSNLSVSPDWDDKGNIKGYAVSNTVTVTLHDLKSAGAIIDAAAAKAGNDIRLQGVMLSIDDTSDLVAKARADAVKDALTQGQQLAAAGGIKLGAIHTIDTTGTVQPQPQYFAERYAKMALDTTAAVPIEPGTQELSIDVNVVFDIG